MQDLLSIAVDFHRVHPEVDLSILLTPYEEAIADALSVHYHKPNSYFQQYWVNLFADYWVRVSSGHETVSLSKTVVVTFLNKSHLFDYWCIKGTGEEHSSNNY